MTTTLACKSNEAVLNLWCVFLSPCLCVQSRAWKCWSQGKGPSLALVHCAKGTLHAHRASWGQMELLCGKSRWCQTRHEDCRLPSPSTIRSLGFLAYSHGAEAQSCIRGEAALLPPPPNTWTSTLLYLPLPWMPWMKKNTERNILLYREVMYRMPKHRCSFLH